MCVTVVPSITVTPSRSSARAALAERRGGNVAEHAIGCLHQQDAGQADVRRAELARQRVARKLGDLSCHLDTRRAAAYDHERQPGRAPLGVMLGLRGLECREDAAPHFECALERLDLQREWPPLVVTEEGVARAAGDDQRVVRDDGPALAVRKSAERDAAALEIEPAHLA